MNRRPGTLKSTGHASTHVGFAETQMYASGVIENRGRQLTILGENLDMYGRSTA